MRTVHSDQLTVKMMHAGSSRQPSVATLLPEEGSGVQKTHSLQTLLVPSPEGAL